MASLSEHGIRDSYVRQSVVPDFVLCQVSTFLGVQSFRCVHAAGRGDNFSGKKVNI